MFFVVVVFWMIQIRNSQEDYFKGIVCFNYNNDDVYEMLSIIAENMAPLYE